MEIRAKEVWKGGKREIASFDLPFLSSVDGEALLEAKKGLRAVENL